jgi:hypothetical protein
MNARRSSRSPSRDLLYYSGDGVLDDIGVFQMNLNIDMSDPAANQKIKKATDDTLQNY